eukprot:INCI7139.1.p1 GENE.INCI7139.1~~INCI7139.1.p1  ORF type:complete len:850 (-),score=140.63 INCI7139.1:81-2477(-)
MPGGNCSGSWFPEFTGTTGDVSVHQQTVFNNLVQFARDLTMGGYSADSVSRLGLSVAAYNIWGTLMFIFLVCAGIPLLACLCCTSCRSDRRRVYQIAYPVCGCTGYLPPTISFCLNWGSLVCLAVAAPFTLQKLGASINNWSCGFTAALDDARLVIHDVQVTSDHVFHQVTSSVDGTVGFVDGMLNQVQSNTTFIDATVEATCDSMYNGCTTITSSASYKNLESLAASGSFTPIDCSQLHDVAPDVSKEVKQVLSVISQARSSVADANKTGQKQIADAQQEVNGYISDASIKVNDIEFNVLDYVVNIGRAIPPFIPEAGDYSASDLTGIAAASLPNVAASVCSLTYLAAVFWGCAILTLICVQRALNRAREARVGAVSAGAMYLPSDEAAEQGLISRETRNTRRNHKSEPLLERPPTLRDLARREPCLTNGSCGRSCNAAGCVFGYCGALVLALVSIVALTIAPVLSDVATFYYVAPYDVSSALDVLIESQLLDNVSSTEVNNITSMVDICIFGAENASLAAAASYAGYDIATLIDQAIDFSPVNFSQYGNVTEDIETARVAAFSAWSMLQTDYSFTDSQMATANAAADDCCQYEDLFKLWVSDCSDTSSQCYACQSTSAGVCNPGKTCSPDAGSVQAKCKAIAADARSVMQQATTLVQDQQNRFNDIQTALTAIEDVDIEKNTNAAIARFNDIAPVLVADVDRVQCKRVGDAYYGLYTEIMQPVSLYAMRFGGFITAITFHTIVLMFLTFTVNKRLGSGGIERVRAVTSVAQVDSLPVAEPMRNGAESPTFYEAVNE